jgi:hypothetical protein
MEVSPVSNTGIYCSSDEVDTVYIVFENSTVNINTLCNSCEDMACFSSVQWNSSASETVRNRTHVHIHFCLGWPILWPARIFIFLPGTLCIIYFIKILDCIFSVVLNPILVTTFYSLIQFSFYYISYCFLSVKYDLPWCLSVSVYRWVLTRLNPHSPHTVLWAQRTLLVFIML